MIKLNKDDIKLYIFYSLALGISRCFSYGIQYSENKSFDSFMSVFPIVLFLLYLVKKIYQCIKGRRDIYIYLYILAFITTVIIFYYRIIFLKEVLNF